jgi:hypothetical protein
MLTAREKILKPICYRLSYYQKIKLHYKLFSATLPHITVYCDKIYEKEISNYMKAYEFFFLFCYLR